MTSDARVVYYDGPTSSLEVHHFECARIRQIVKSRRIVKKHRPSRGAYERSKQLDPA